MLLQLAHFATMLALNPSQAWLQHILEIMTLFQNNIGLEKLPPVVVCFLDSIRKSSKNLPLDQGAQLEINKTIVDFTVAQSLEPAAQPGMPNGSVATEMGRVSNQSSEGIQPSSISFPQPFNEPVPARHHQRPNPSTLLDDLIPHMNPSQPEQLPRSFSPLDADFTSPTMDGYDPSISGDLESFFDELASLHGAKKLQNQPQFMQNLGFAPEVSMADILATQSGQYMPMNSATFGAEHEGEALQFPLSDYYDAS
jgi:hypothetical protein